MTTLAVGDPAPDFALADQTGSTVKLSDLRGRRVLLYFYPKADTPGCTTQSCAVRDARDDFGELEADVLGISPSPIDAQARFDSKFSLGFPLLSDPMHETADAYGVWGERSLYGRKYMGIVRSSFLLGADGRIEGAWYGVTPKETVPLALAALRSP
ncbi:MAG: thioredoxin-dependent thiol peroxidase [Actinomycetota bacterium]